MKAAGLTVDMRGHAKTATQQAPPANLQETTWAGPITVTPATPSYSYRSRRVSARSRLEKIGFWITDYFSPEAIRFGEKMRARFMRNAPFQFNPKDWFSFFGEHGWRASEIRYISEEANRLGRPIPLPFFMLAWIGLKSLFASRARRDRMKKFAAYVLLLPE